MKRLVFLALYCALVVTAVPDGAVAQDASVMTIKAGSTAADATDRSLVVGLSPNSPLPAPGTGATSLGKAEDGGHATGDTGVAGLLVRKDTNAVLTSADGDYVMEAGDNYGAAFARVDHPNRILCTVTVSTATTLTAVGGSCAAPGTGLSIYITDILFASSAQAIIADTFPTLKYGTGGTCGSGTTAFWGAFQAAAVPATTVQSLKTPIKIPANNEVCWINSTVGSKFVVIAGFIAP